MNAGKPLGRRAQRRRLMYPGNRANPLRPRRQRLYRKPRTGGWK